MSAKQQLTLRLEPRARVIDVARWSVMGAPGLEWERLECDAAAPSALHAIEDAVYDRSGLAGEDWARVRALVSLPEVAALTGDGPLPEPFTAADDLGPGTRLAWTPDEKLAAFLRRSFTGVTIEHALTPLARWCSATTARSGGGHTLYVHVRHREQIDLIGCRGEQIVLAATHACPGGVDDAAYYALAALRLPELGAGSDQTRLFVCGAGSIRRQVAQRLGGFVRGGALPVIFPSEMFKAGRSAMQVPFDLIVSHLL